jgi:hypothetical protein
MSKDKENVSHEAPNDDPRENAGDASMAQSDKPWKQNLQRTTDPSQADTPKPDLETWAKSKTH